MVLQLCASRGDAVKVLLAEAGNLVPSLAVKTCAIILI